MGDWSKLWRGAPLRGCNCLLWLPDSKAVDVVRESWLQNAKAGAVSIGLTTFGNGPEGCQGAKGAYKYVPSTHRTPNEKELFLLYQTNAATSHADWPKSVRRCHGPHQGQLVDKLGSECLINRVRVPRATASAMQIDQ